MAPFGGRLRAPLAISLRQTVRRLEMTPTTRPTRPSHQIPAACFLGTPHSLRACRPVVTWLSQFTLWRAESHACCWRSENAHAVAVFCRHQVRTARVHRSMRLNPRGARVSIFPLDSKGVFRGMRWAVGSEFGRNVIRKIENDVYLLS